MPARMRSIDALIGAVDLILVIHDAEYSVAFGDLLPLAVQLDPMSIPAPEIVGVEDIFIAIDAPQMTLAYDDLLEQTGNFFPAAAFQTPVRRAIDLIMFVDATD